MPDFEALVRHQQINRRPTNERLKVVQKVDTSAQVPPNDGRNLSTLFFGFVGGVSGSIIGTGLIFYLTAKNLIDLKSLF